MTTSHPDPKYARVSVQVPSVAEVGFDDPSAALEFVQLVNSWSDNNGRHFSHLVIAETVGERTNYIHSVLATELDDDPTVFAELVAATYDADVEDAGDLPKKTDRGYEYDFGARVINVHKLRPISNLMASQLTEILPVHRAEDLRYLINESSDQRPAAPGVR